MVCGTQCRPIFILGNLASRFLERSVWHQSCGKISTVFSTTDKLRKHHVEWGCWLLSNLEWAKFWFDSDGSHHPHLMSTSGQGAL